MRKRFSLRSFVSFCLFFVLVVLLVSGVVLHIAPPGRISNWVNWKFLGLTKGQWEAVHTIPGFLFVVFGIWHLILNWPAFKHYIVKRGSRGLNMWKELTLAFVIVIFIVSGSVTGIPPFGNIMNTGERARNFWERRYSAPPVPHLELKTIKEIAGELGINHDEAVRKLKERGISDVYEDKTLEEIGKANGISPEYLYNILKSKGKESERQKEGRAGEERRGNGGYGRITLKELCEMEDIGMEKVMDFFKERGMEVSPDERLRDIASEMGITPYQLTEELKKLRGER